MERSERIKLFQIECHMMLNQKPLIEFCKSKDIVVEGYSPFGSPTRPDAGQDAKNVLQDEKVLQVAAEHGKSAGQVILRYLVRSRNKQGCHRPCVLFCRSLDPVSPDTKLAKFSASTIISNSTVLNLYFRKPNFNS